MLYRLFFKLVLVHLDPERAHGVGLRLLRVAFWLAPLRSAVRKFTAPSERLSVKVFDRDFPSPLGVAAGVDKDATSFSDLETLGFGHIEVGTVTPRPQAGNPRPRIFRLPRQRAVINRMGFPNQGHWGAFTAIEFGREANLPPAVNIGKNKDTAPENAAQDYAIVAEMMFAHCAFLVINVSSPNTPGLRDLQAVEPLRAIVEAVQQVVADPDCAVLLKISPDLADTDIDDIVDLAIELGLAGIVCTNTTIARDALPPGDYEQGGLSGEPLKERSLEVLERVRGRAGERLTLVAVGGISTADDVWERLVAGATLVQAYTGFVYGGPLWPRRINRGLLKLLDDSGFDSIADVIGSARV